MRVDSATLFRSHYGNGVKYNGKHTHLENANSIDSRIIPFTGRNVGQIASLTPENNGLGLAEAKQGGEGAVGYQAIASLRGDEHCDARSFMPFWNHNNPNGGFKFLIHPEREFPKGVAGLPDEMEARWFYSAPLGQTREQAAAALHLKPSELSYVIQSAPNGSGPTALSQYCLLEPTEVSGSVQRPSSRVLGELDEIPYQLFKISEHNPKYNELKGQPHYFLYTPDLAKSSKPYSYGVSGSGAFDAEIVNSDWMRALADIFVKNKMDTKEFGHFDPANMWCHDRVAHTFANHVANMSADGHVGANGLKIHITEHNPGEYYQGTTDDPFAYFRVIGDKKDVEKIKTLPDYEILAKAQRFGINNLDELSEREHRIAWAVMEPALRPFRDKAGHYNIIKSGIAAVRQNPENVSLGTVSHTFDREMKSLDTPDAAKNLTEDFASIPTKSVLNGSTPAKLKLDEADAKFGFGGNELSKPNSGYTPFKYNGTNIEEVIDTCDKNAKWLTGRIWEAGQQGQEALNKLFFNVGQIQKGMTVHGYLSPIKDGEILVFGFGRPDEQKGFPISTGGYLEFLKRDDVPQEMKLKVKCFFGGGKWNENASDYKAIMRDLNEIWNLDGGIYRHNIMYADGITPNRFVACAHYCLFTSRREMCGITPLEAKAAGRPYGTTKTGGPVDYTNSTNGFLTKEAVELRPEVYGLPADVSREELDAVRVKRQAQQTSDILKDMIETYTNDKKRYIEMAKTNIEEEFDWYNNAKYNKGKSANKMYLEDIFEYDKPFENRNRKPLKRLIEDFGVYAEEKAEEFFNIKIKVRPLRIALMVVGGALVLGSSLYYICKHHKKSAKKVLDNVA